MGQDERRSRSGLVTDFQASPSYLICALGNKISVAAARTIRRQLGLSLMEWRVLAVLAAEPAASPGRIIEVSGVDKSGVSRAVNSLVGQGLVDRRQQPGHGLRTQLHLTPAGWEVHDRGIAARLQAEAELLDGVAPAERERLAETLRLLTGNIEKMLEAAK